MLKEIKKLNDEMFTDEEVIVVAEKVLCGEDIDIIVGMEKDKFMNVFNIEGLDVSALMNYDNQTRGFAHVVDKEDLADDLIYLSVLKSQIS